MWKIVLFIILALSTSYGPTETYNGEPVQMGFWQFVAQAGLMGLNALLSRKKKKDAGEDAGPLTPQEMEAIQMLMQTGELSIEQAESMFGISRDLIQQAQTSFQGASEDLGSSRDYFNKLMTGDTATRAEFFAPETQRIQDTYSQATEQARRFGSEGGESDRLKSDLRMAKTGELARLFSSARPAAAAGLMQTAQIGAGIGSAQAGAGASLANSGVGALGVASNAAGNVLTPFSYARQDQTTRRGQNIGIWSDIGKGVGGILADIWKNKGLTKGGISGPRVGEAKA